MKSRKWTVFFSCMALFVGLLTAPGLAAKKPVKPPPDPQIDPCEETGFSPDFTFWRETGRRKSPEATIYLADALTACEKTLAVVPLGEGGWLRGLKLSTVADGYVFGRVVWLFRGTDIGGVWSQDFTIDGSSVEQLGGPRELLHFDRGDPETDQDTYVLNVDLSPDASTLAYDFVRHDAAGSSNTLRLLRVSDVTAACGGEPCSADTGVSLVLGELTGDNWFAYPTWAPSGDRIYVREWLTDGDSTLVYYNLDWATDWPPSASAPQLLFSEADSPEYPDYVMPRWLTAGTRDGREVLAFEREPNPYLACEDVYVIDVEACIADVGNCFDQPAFSGRHPSWTRTGQIVHEVSTWDTNSGNCATYDVGIWDGESPVVLMPGKEPDAAIGSE